MNKKKDGFTLFELLVSISIIAILTAMVSVSYSVAQKKARDARRMQDMEMIQKAAEQYYSLNNYLYPATASYSVGTSWAVSAQTVLESYPADPKNVTPYIYVALGSGTTNYCICADLEGDKGNSLTNGCSFAGVGGTGGYFCVKNQQ